MLKVFYRLFQIIRIYLLNSIAEYITEALSLSLDEHPLHFIVVAFDGF